MRQNARWTTWLAAALVAALTGVARSQQVVSNLPAPVATQARLGPPPSIAVLATTAAAETNTLDAAVRRLIAEAHDLTLLDKPVEHPAAFTRPHPALKSLDAASALPALIAMTGKLTDKPALDNYVRWHLLEVYKKAPPASRRDKGMILLELYNSVTDPEPLNVATKVEYIYTPEELWRRYRPPSRPGPAHVGAPAVVTGYPPFQRVLTGSAALAQMSPEQVAAYHLAVAKAARDWERNKAAAEAAAIFARLTRVDYPENVAFNKRLHEANARLSQLSHITRSLRLELIYEMLKTGDPKMLNMVGDAIARRLEKGDHFGFELMAFVYLAGYDGVLQLYSARDLRNFSNGMESIARRFEGYRSYSGITRDFADYAFTLIVALRNGDHLIIDQAHYMTMLDEAYSPSRR